MASIIYVGMDVHTTNYTMCCYTVLLHGAATRLKKT